MATSVLTNVTIESMMHVSVSARSVTPMLKSNGPLAETAAVAEDPSTVVFAESGCDGI